MMSSTICSSSFNGGNFMVSPLLASSSSSSSSYNNRSKCRYLINGPNSRRICIQLHPVLFPVSLRSSSSKLIDVQTVSIKKNLSFLADLQLCRSFHGNGDDNNSNGSGGSNNNNYNNNNNNNPFDGNGDGDSIGTLSSSTALLLLLSAVFCYLFHCELVPGVAIARTITANSSTDAEDAVWEVKGSKWTQLIPDFSKDVFVSVSSTLSLSSSLSLEHLWLKCRELVSGILLPEGYPQSVTPDYLEYSLWRSVQGVASQVSGVLATQALLYAVGLGKGAIPTAAAINWVLKDGIGYLSKIMLSKYGRHFDVHPKGWRLFADLLENAAFGMEMITPAFPHLFVVIGAVAGAGRSAAALIQAATRSCFYAGFAAQRNFAEVIAKGEAQGMMSKFVGIMLGIALANCVGSSTTYALASFSVVTWIHMFCNLKSYQAIHLRTLNPYRASLVFVEYLLSGQAPPIKEVNDEEPLFPCVPFLNLRSEDKAQLVALSVEAKVAAAEIERRLQLGSRLSDIVNSKEDALALCNLYKDEGYILTEHNQKFCVVLKESSSQQDMLRALFQVSYLYWLENNAGIQAKNALTDCKPGGRLHMSLSYVQREFNHVKNDSESVGWITDGLIARPSPYRIRLDFAGSST